MEQTQTPLDHSRTGPRGTGRRHVRHRPSDCGHRWGVRSRRRPVWQNNGIPAHQSLPHLHFHVAGTLPDGGTDWGDVPKLTLAQTDAIAPPNSGRTYDAAATAQADRYPVRTASERRVGDSQCGRTLLSLRTTRFGSYCCPCADNRNYASAAAGSVGAP